jgi:hypothetical protein
VGVREDYLGEAVLVEERDLGWVVTNVLGQAPYERGRSVVKSDGKEVLNSSALQGDDELYLPFGAHRPLGGFACPGAG